MENQTEHTFKNWLDKHTTPYWHISQDIDSFSPALKKIFTKRPDFAILLPNIGLLFVDVKNKKQRKMTPLL